MKKRLVMVVLAMCLAISLLACGKKTTDETTALQTQTQMTWQEQYDLGIRLLNEGKYEDAILAFLAAIQIDPKRADAYVNLSNVYMATGQVGKAQDVLINAMEKVDNAATIQEKLDNIQQNSETETVEETEVEVVMDWSNDFGSVPFNERENYISFDEMNQEEQDVVNACVNMAGSDSMELWSDVLESAKVLVSEDGSVEYYTFNEGQKILVVLSKQTLSVADMYSIDALDGDIDQTRYTLYFEMRVENGKGYAVNYYEREGCLGVHYLDGNMTNREYETGHWHGIVRTEGECVDWQWDGLAQVYQASDLTAFKNDQMSRWSKTSQTETGMFEKGLKEGTFVIQGESSSWREGAEEQANVVSTTKEFVSGVYYQENQGYFFESASSYIFEKVESSFEEIRGTSWIEKIYW